MGSFWKDLILSLQVGSHQHPLDGPLGMVRTCLGMVTSFCSQQFSVTHMPSSALSSPPTR